MKTTLRLGFAMGGGVSLGTFCGEALTQAIKLLIVYGQDRNQQYYDRVEIDVFSGASAGALSLCAMLRSLAEGNPELVDKARGMLHAEFGAALARLSESQFADLVAAQIAQFKQEELWSKEIKLERLLDAGGDGLLRRRASILDRSAVDRIARDHIVRWPDHQAGFARRRLLADRVLYACTLSNLTPVLADATSSLPGAEVGYVGLADGLRSHSHRDLRVFDLHFVREQQPNDEEHPQRWCRYHNAAEKEGKIGDLREERSWAKIAATAIASGAFPGAFEPVVLRRRAYEFGRKLWCATFGIKSADYDPAAEYSFSYADGGMFNNEPIREAFRLASFIDGHAPMDDQNQVERLIVFVDPFVSDATPGFNLSVHRQWALEEPNVFGSLDGYDLRRRNSLDRLLPHLGTLIGAISNESRTIEADRIAQVREVFNLRTKVRRSLDSTLSAQAPAAEFERLKSFITQELSSSAKDEVIPPGPLTIAGELERVINEEAAREEEEGLPSGQRVFEPLRGTAFQFLALPNPSQAPSASVWLRLLTFTAVDLILGLEGKLERAKLVAIAPFHDLKTAEQKNLRPPKFDLPGGRLGGFAGFMSDVSDELEYRTARYCAAEFLRECGVLDPATPLPSMEGIQLSAEEWIRFRKDVQLGLDALSKRVGQLVTDSHLINVCPGLDGLLGKIVGGIARKAVAKLDWEEHHRVLVELRVIVPNERFELDGRGPLGGVDCAPVENEGSIEWQLITLATFDFDTGSWSGGFVKDGTLDIDEDGTVFSSDKDFCSVTLPSPSQVAAALRIPTAQLSLRLQASDRGKTVSPDRWSTESGVIPLDDELV